MTNLSRYCTLNGVDLTDYIAFNDPPHPIQPKRFMKSSPIIGGNRNVLWSEGMDVFGYEVNCQFDPSLWESYDTVTGLFQNLTDGDLFYPRSDRFMICKYGSCVPVQSKSYGPGQGLRLKGTLWSEAAELYSATPSSWSPTDETLPITESSGETNNGNIEAPLYSMALTARMSGPALKFDGEGSDDYLNCGTPDLSSANDSVSVEMWVLAPPVTAEYYPGLYIYGADYTTSGGFTVAVNPPTATNNRIYMGFGTGADVVFNYMGELPINVWCHVIFIHDVDAEYDYYYLNGALVNSVDTSGSTPASIAATQALKTGLRTADTSEMSVTIAGMRVWVRTLSAAEAEDAYLGEAVSDTDLVIEYGFCEGRGQWVNDLSGNSNNGTLTNFADTSAGYGDSHDGGWLTSIGPVSPALELLGAADAVMDSLTLTSGLMTAEVLAQDRFGQITQTYVDDFTADVGRPAFGNGYFWADGHFYSKVITSLAGDDNDFVLTSIYGKLGNWFSLTLVNAGSGKSLDVTVSAWDISVQLETDGGGVIQSTAQEVIDAINADAEASLLVVASLKAGNDGTGVVTALAKTYSSSNVSINAGALVIEDDREAEYHLVGVHPIAAGGLRVTFTPTMTGAGVASFEVSIDSGSTWETVITSASWADGAENEVYVPQGEGYTEVWIRWACDADITSIAIDDLEIYQKRYVSDSVVPKIPVGSTYKIQIDGAGWGDAATVWRNRYIP